MIDRLDSGPEAAADPDLDALRPARRWVPRHVLVTRSAAELPHGQQILDRCRAAGVDDVTVLAGDRLPSLRGGTDREVYARAKQTLAVVVAPPSALRPQPIPPSADWRLDLAKGCPAHCQYCYLAGSLSGSADHPGVREPRRRTGADPGLAGRGSVTTGDALRAGEGTTFELSCYTDPLGLEAVTGSLSSAVARVGRGEYGDGVGLRFTTKFDDVAPLVGLPHGGRTRVRLSVNSAAVARRFEGGTASVPARLAALRAARARRLPGGPDDRAGHATARLAGRLRRPPAATPRPRSTGCPTSISPSSSSRTASPRPAAPYCCRGTRRPSSTSTRPAAARSARSSGQRSTSTRAPLMREMRAWFDTAVSAALPQARILYWT